MKSLDVKHGANSSIAQAGEWCELRQHVFNHPLIGKVPGKVFLKDALRLTGMEVSLGVIPAGHGTPFLHAHRQNEELYIFVKGRGQFVVDGEVLAIQEGTVVRVAPAGARAWRNTSSEDLYYIVVQAKAGTLVNGTITDGVEVPGSPEWNQQG
jgi:mannose-6-phosphate isomerase-like protein (cupin superfamily)